MSGERRRSVSKRSSGLADPEERLPSRERQDEELEKLGLAVGDFVKVAGELGVFTVRGWWWDGSVRCNATGMGARSFPADWVVPAKVMGKRGRMLENRVKEPQRQARREWLAERGMKDFSDGSDAADGFTPYQATENDVTGVTGDPRGVSGDISSDEGNTSQKELKTKKRRSA